MAAIPMHLKVFIERDMSLRTSGRYLMLRSRSMLVPESGSLERTKMVLVMRSTAVDGADAAGRDADSCSEKPELSCSKKCCVRSCNTAPIKPCRFS